MIDDSAQSEIAVNALAARDRGDHETYLRLLRRWHDWSPVTARSVLRKLAAENGVALAPVTDIRTRQTVSV